MAWIQTKIKDVWVFEPKIWGDHRGYFLETFNKKDLPPALKEIEFVQDNEAKSTKGVLRGLHFQKAPFAQSKLVRCVYGEVLDVIIDMRKSSPSCGKTFSIILNDITKKQLFVPKGFAHGYVVLSDEAVFAYKCDDYYKPELEGGVRFDDPTLNIDWILSNHEFKISEKDLKLPCFIDAYSFE